jgi:hypothetical protein
MKTATKVVQLPGLGLNAYEVEGRPYVSMREMVKATRPTSNNTDPLTKWIEGTQNSSDTNGSQGFPQSFEGAQMFECNVPRAQGGTSVAKLFSPAVAWHWILNELTNRSAAVQQRALKLVQIVGAIRYSQSSEIITT